MEQIDSFKRYQIKKTAHAAIAGKKPSFGGMFKYAKSKGWLGISAYIGAMGLLLFLILISYYMVVLPSPLAIEDNVEIESTKIFDREGNLLYEIHAQEGGKRTLLNYNEIPRVVVNATLAIEDDKFFQHQGIDIPAFTMAVFKYIFTGDKSRGGSTITQQLVKNTLLSREKTIDRKLREVLLSILTERTYTKEKILEMYLNKIPYGNNAYGIFAASKTYFNKAPADLSIAEAAFLAAIPQMPTYYNPYGPNLEQLHHRKEYAINRMYDLGLITEDQRYSAFEEEIEIYPYSEPIKHPHFVMYVKDLLAQKYGEDILATKGLRVYTTLDPLLQNEAEKIVEEQIANYGEWNNTTNGAMMAVNPKTGEILTMVGSVDYFNKEIDGQYNVALAKRQPGSSIKPLVYLAAFMKGYTPATVVWDVFTNFGNNYKPNNYDSKFRGPITLRNSLAQSLNIPAVKALYLAGVPNVINLGKELGLTTLTQDPWYYGLSFVLGGGEVRLIDMMQMYSIFANGGKKNDLTPILKIVDSNGVVVDELQPPQNVEMIDEKYVYLLSNILSDNVARSPAFGSRNYLTLEGRPVAAKTGTTNGYKDAWTFGYTPQIVVGVWAGNNDNIPLRWGASGHVMAAPMWNKFMRFATKDMSIEKFEKPQGITTIEISTLTGKIPSEFTPADKKRYEIFVKGTEPHEIDDYLIYKKVEKMSGKLATEDCPEGSIEYWVYENAHSIRPELSNWEVPVQEYIKGYHPVESIEGGGVDVKFVTYDQLPEEYATWCDDPKYHEYTTMSLVSPKDGEVFLKDQKKVFVEVVVGDEKLVDNVEFYLDDVKVAEVIKPPFRREILLQNVELGKDYELKAIMHSIYFYTIEDKVNIRFANDISPISMGILSPGDNAVYQQGQDIVLTVQLSNIDDFDKINYYLNGKFQRSFVSTDLEGSRLNKVLYTSTWPIGKNKVTLRSYDIDGNESEEIIYINIEE